MPADQDLRVALDEVNAVAASSAKLKQCLQALQAELESQSELVQALPEGDGKAPDSDQLVKIFGSEKLPGKSAVLLPAVLTERWGCRGDNVDRNQSKPSLKSSSTGRGTKLKMYGFWEEVQSKCMMSAMDMLREGGKGKRGIVHKKSFVQEVIESFGRRRSVAGGALNMLDSAIKEPHSQFHIAWCLMGFFLVLYDGFCMPIAVAWDWKMSLLTQVPLVISSTYWALDILVSLQTGFTHRGTLVTDRVQMAKRYIRSWFILDLSMSALDVFSVTVALTLREVDRALGWARLVRFLRLLRLLRLLKGRVFEEKLDAIFGYSALQYVELCGAVAKTLITVLLVVHILGCSWYMIGKSQAESENQSWLKEYHFEDGKATELHQYLVSVHWVFAQISPAPMRVQPTNEIEQGYNIIVIIFALLVVGGSISRISQSIQQVLKLSAEANQRKRQVSLFLKSHNIGVQLSTRILHFVDHTLGRRKKTMLDTSLITERMRKEINMASRGPMLRHNSIFELIDELFHTVFIEVCDRLKMDSREEGESIFKKGTLSQVMYIVRPGTYYLDGLQEVFEAPRFFAEVALCAPYLHSSSLQCKEIADVFTLSGRDFSECCVGMPACGSFIYQYCRNLCSAVNNGKVILNDELPAEIREDSSTSTNVWQALNSAELNSIEQFFVHADYEVASVQDVENLLNLVKAGQIEAPQICQRLESMFPELMPEAGTHSCYSAPAERSRALSSLVSVIYLITDRYEEFSLPQAASNKLSVDAWRNMQEFLNWSGIKSKPDWVRCVLVFLAIKGLGKSEKLLLQVPGSCQGPESSVVYALQNAPRLMPSAALNENRIHDMLITYKDFNLGQFLQAENSPASVLCLQEQPENQEGVRASLVAALGLMCGIMGAVGPDGTYGSKFMDANHSRPIMMSLKCLQNICDCSCQEIYWGYIATRARSIGIHINSVDDAAFARLACQCRIIDPGEELQHLSCVWNSLDSADRLVLVENFIADGIYQSGILFLYLPFCLAHAKTNPNIGVHAMLMQLVELTAWAQCRVGQSTSLLTINLSNLATFIATVKSKAVFNAFLDHCGLVEQDAILYLNVGSESWSQVDDVDTHEFPLTSSLRRITRKQSELQKSIDALHSQISASAVKIPPRFHFDDEADYQDL